jgi:hypothetical protein
MAVRIQQGFNDKPFRPHHKKNFREIKRRRKTPSRFRPRDFPPATKKKHKNQKKSSFQSPTCLGDFKGRVFEKFGKKNVRHHIDKAAFNFRLILLAPQKILGKLTKAKITVKIEPQRFPVTKNPEKKPKKQTEDKQVPKDSRLRKSNKSNRKRRARGQLPQQNHKKITQTAKDSKKKTIREKKKITDLSASSKTT